jgi:DNA-binding Lrp family transcriptional regulator
MDIATDKVSPKPAVMPHIQLPPDQALMRMLVGYWNTQCIYTAAKLGIPEQLKDGPQSSDELAEKVNASADHLYRLMRTLASIGIFKELSLKIFCNTELSELLRPEVPASMYSIAIMIGDMHYKAWQQLLNGVKEGCSAYELAYGMPIFDYIETNSELKTTFHRAMADFSQNTFNLVIEAYDFSDIGKIVDVGGGQGALLTTILRKYENLKGVLFDLPQVINNGTSQLLKEFAGRCEIVGGDFFKSVDIEGDAYILSNIIHDWGDEQAVQILKNIHTIMHKDGKILLVEYVVEADNQPCLGKFLDIHMMVVTRSGRERSEEEFRQLFAAAGFKLTRNLSTRGAAHILEAIKI